MSEHAATLCDVLFIQRPPPQRFLYRVKVPPRQFPQGEFTPPPGATTVVLIRHGQSIPAVEGKRFALMDGQGDPPLSPRGLMQADAVGQRLKDEAIDAIYVSGLTRTVQTAAPLAAHLGIEPVEDPDLREVFLGVGEGGEFRRMSADDEPPVLAMRASREWGEIPGAETNLELTTRVVAGLNRIAASHPNQVVAVVCHGGVIGAALGHTLSVNPFRFAGARNGSIHHLVIHDADWMVRSFNDASHIGSLFADRRSPEG